MFTLSLRLRIFTLLHGKRGDVSEVFKSQMLTLLGLVSPPPLSPAGDCLL